LSLGRIFFVYVPIGLVIAGLVYTGVWHMFTLFVWQHPMLTWLPMLAAIVVGFAVGGVRQMTRAGGAPSANPPPKPTEQMAAAGATDAGQTPAPTPAPTRPPLWAAGPGLLAFLVVLVLGLWFTLVSPKEMSLDEIDYEVVDKLPQTTQPRLLPRAGVDDDPRFRDAKEVHLVRDPRGGELMWSGEWQGSWTGSESAGVSVRPLDDVVLQSQIYRSGFDKSVAGITPGTLKGKANLSHPFSRIQYPVLVPTGPRSAIAVAPYAGYAGFPFRYPYQKGVLVYNQDGEVEDLTPEEAASRPELVRTGRLFPESVARAQAEALAASDEFEGEIEDAKGNKQPFLTSIDENTTVWLTIINEEGANAGVKAVVIADSSTGETEVWKPGPGERLISTEQVIDEAEALPITFEEERCCDSEGDSYTETLREVVEPRLAFKDGEAYYMVTVVPTDAIAVGREVEYTLVIDAESGKVVDQIHHTAASASDDARLQAFFAGSSGGSGKD
jgi:hypothetical protein